MTNVVSAELYKLRYNVTFYVCIVVAIVVSMFNVFTTASDTAISMFEGAAVSTNLFLLIMLTALACEDYEKNTMKNLISSGNSRWHIYCGKIIAGIVIGLIFFLVDGFASVIAGYMVNGLGAKITVLAVLESLVVQLLLMVVYVLTFFGISSIVRTSKFGIILGFVYTIVVGMIPWMMDSLVHIDASAFSMTTFVNNISSLHLSPTMIINFIIYGGIAIIFNVIGYLRFKKFEV